ncbi:HK97-gp10 family putative phage morphogenesis protein [Devosia sp. MC521]|uniref:HK97-gp10 family putative phage morphogenesis protein n=1 Tax=Devosia sp. MC521 TaxID=2759954 RepID=UPI0015FAD7A7|nr:HK97-gp10 family putative phage morphogenesis protein [Devosia sp. MC521]MBJ6986941.1 HK97 gp10 family phage protein [Devosia sp. MC521]QMW63965.1 HK97 gp10 family phage protein [Devosia sp. MC521]
MATRIQGLESLKRKLRAFPKAVESEIRKAMEQSANEIVALAKSLAPVDSGDLQMSISWTWGEAPKGAIVLGRVKSGATATGNMKITVFAGGGDAYYARMIEFGTAPHLNGGRFAGSKHPGSAAQPFFYPAYRAVRKRAKGRVTRAVNKAAKRIAAGG